MLIRKAKVAEASLLTELTVRSKAYWGYSEHFMEVCLNELVVAQEKLENPNFIYYVLKIDGKLVGYYGLEPLSKSDIELSALFIEPRYIGTGLGKILLLAAIKAAREMGGENLTLQADPNAAAFYSANGGILTGKKESSSFPGRYLPTFNFSLSIMY